MQVIILAGGMGKRLRPLTYDVPKVMVKVAGREMLLRQLDIVSTLQGVSEIIIVVGYKRHLIKKLVGKTYNGIKIRFVENPQFKHTNNVYSLYLGLKFVKEDVLLLEGDILFKEQLLKEIIRNENTVLVEKFKSYMDGAAVEIDKKSKTIKRLIPKKEQDDNFEHDKYYKTVNIYHFTHAFINKTYRPSLEYYIRAIGKKDFYELVIGALIYLNNCRLRAQVINEAVQWVEIDDVIDLNFAENVFLAKNIDFIKEKYGGYWNFDFIDFCYLYNMYFPPPKFIREITENASCLLGSYPSGQNYLRLLLSSFFDFEIHKEHIFIGNGASELIRILNKNLIGSITVPTPTFNEYIDASDHCKLNIYKLSAANDFKINVKDLVKKARKFNFLAIVNPNNPTGKTLSREKIIYLLNNLKELDGIIIDESFIDFSKEESCMDLVDKYNNLIFVKSLSKSHGIPGLRLGFLYTNSHKVITTINKHLPVWNINSFAEKFLEKFTKYEEDFEISTKKTIKSRGRLEKALGKITSLKVYESDASYILCKILNKKIMATQLCEKLYVNDSLFIKDLSNKIGPEFIRISVRTDKENRVLTSCLKKYL